MISRILSLTDFFQVGFHGYLLEFRGCSICTLIVYIWPLATHIHSKTYVYSVVYMASHDPSMYRFSTPIYILLFTTLITAYYMSVLFNIAFAFHLS